MIYILTSILLIIFSFYFCSITITISDNTNISCDFIQHFWDSIIIEKCIICDDGMPFDLVEFIEEKGISLADKYSKSYNDIEYDFLWVISTIDKCNLLKKRCVICHTKNSTKSDNTTTYQTSSNTNTNSNNRKFTYINIPYK